MMRCQRMEQQLIPYLDGKLSASQQESVAAHLERCPHCAAALEGLSEICALLDAEREIAVPAEFEGEVVRRIRRLEGASSSGRWAIPANYAGRSIYSRVPTRASLKTMLTGRRHRKAMAGS